MIMKINCFYKTINRSFCIILILSIHLISCVSTQKTAYFNAVKQSEIANSKYENEIIIQKNDLLDIKITSLNLEASKVFNTTPSSEINNTNLIGTIGHQVDNNGFIKLAYIGNIKAEGLTKQALKDSIVYKLNTLKLLLDPTVSIRLLNFKVSVLGEVSHPALITFQTDKVTVLDALASAGDLTIYGKRNNVLIIRQENGKTHFERLNLLNSDIFTSPYYYLKSNDIIYVEPDKNRVFAASKFVTLLPAIMSTLSVIIVILSRYK